MFDPSKIDPEDPELFRLLRSLGAYDIKVTQDENGVAYTQFSIASYDPAIEVKKKPKKRRPDWLKRVLERWKVFDLFRGSRWGF